MVTHHWFKTQAAHSFFLDSDGMPKQVVPSCGSFGFFLNLIGIESQIAQEYITDESLCHVLLSVKLIVWICLDILCGQARS